MCEEIHVNIPSMKNGTLGPTEDKCDWNEQLFTLSRFRCTKLLTAISKGNFFSLWVDNTSTCIWRSHPEGT